MIDLDDQPTSSDSGETLTRRTTVGTGWSAASAVGRQVLSFVSVAVLARFVPPSAYGLLSMANLLINFLQNFRDLGTGPALIQRATVSDALLSSVFWVNCGLGALLTGIIWLLAEPASWFFHEAALVSVLHVLSFSFAITSTAVVPTALLSRSMSFKKIAAAELSGAVAGTVLAVVLATRGAGVWSLVWGALTSSGVYVAILWGLCDWRPRKTAAWQEVRTIAAYSLNLFGFTVVNYGARNADNLIVGRFLGSAALGQYNMAYTLMLYPVQSITQVVAQVLFPAFSKLQHDHQRFGSAFVRVCATISIITFPMMAGLTVVAGPFVRVVLGPKWLPVIPLLQILAPVGMFQSMATLVGQIYTALGRTDWMFRAGIFVSSILILSFFAGLPWGIIGVASAYAIANLVIAYPIFAIPFKLIGLKMGVFLRALAPQFGTAGAMALVVAAGATGLKWAGVVSPIAVLSICVGLGIAFYAASVLLLKLPVLRTLAEILRQNPSSLSLRLADFFERYRRRAPSLEA